MRKSTTLKNIKRRWKFRAELFNKGLSAVEIAKKLHTNPHNIRVQISRFRKNYPDLAQVLFPYSRPNNWLIKK
jgi:hypothetical protein